PGKKTISEVSTLLGVSESETIKAVALKSEKKKILVFLRGDLELNLHKLHSLLKIADSEPMTDLEIRELGLIPGFISPIAPNDKIKVLYDRSLQKDFPYVVGSSKEDFHTQGFILEKEISGLPEFADVALAREGDLCPNCSSPLKAEKGIEVGHIFKLGDKYTKAFGIQVLDQNGKSKTLTMGCYGIGVNRTMATVIEQCNDEKGIFWPISIAPFEVSLVSIVKGEDQYSKIEEFYNVLMNEGIEVLWDDRDLGPGFKLKDSELIGFPIRITIGKKFFESGEISIYNRKKDQEDSFVFSGFDDLVARVESIRQELFTELR
ncbi:YbaK/EbsC family protein, partial [Leptospira interrogans]